MQIIKTVEEMQQFSLANKDKQIGFVPTMGFLHDGHLSLIKEAKQENDIVVTSIFVNPLQFGPNEDFEQYPRDTKQDIKRAEAVGNDVLFVPTVDSMYPTKMLIDMKIDQLANVLCGRSRPGHFDGVLKVLGKLFNIILPDKTYFGMKDAQQLAVVNQLIKDLNYPIKLVGLNTVREQDGLAMSSRNVYLNVEERKEALALYNSLLYGQQLVVDGEMNSAKIVTELTKKIQSQTLAKIDYVELLSYPDLQPVELISETIILAVAVQFKQARLIDNIILNKQGEILERIE